MKYLSSIDYKIYDCKMCLYCYLDYKVWLLSSETIGKIWEIVKGNNIYKTLLVKPIFLAGTVTCLYNGLTYLQNNKVDFWFYQLLKDLFKYYYVEADILNPLCYIWATDVTSWMPRHFYTSILDSIGSFL